jgi:predicted AAA+ superfamily ATPase
VARVRDDELRRILTEANPWWRASAAGTDPTAWTKAHRLLRERSEFDLNYRSDALEDVSTRRLQDLFTVLIGPRRVGKSVVLLDAAAELCARPDVDPRQIIHIPCDGMRDRDLRRVLTLGRELTRSVDAQAVQRRVWLLDEITGIPGWSAVLKAARDQSSFGDDTVVATGSRWAESEDIAGNLLSGRAGKASGRRVRHVLPMTFRDFLAATRPDMVRPAVVHPVELQSGPAKAALEALKFDVDAYDLAWQAYLTCGGFPRAVYEYERHGGVSDNYLRDLASWLRSDVDSQAGPESIPLLLAGLTERATSPFNTTNTAGALGYGSRAVLDSRVRKLIATFAAVACPRRDDQGAAVPGAQYKLYLTDPLLAWLPSRLRAGLPDPNMTALTEMSVGVALAAAIERIDEGRWTAGDTIGYLRTASSNEVDLTSVPVPTSAGSQLTVPLETKWVDDGWRGEAKVIEAKFGKGILATKSILDLEHPAWAVPAPIVSLLLR